MINYPPDRVPVETADFVALQRLVHRYADAVVHRDADQWGNCWADDAEWDLGGGRKVTGATAIVDLWKRAMGGMEAVVQTVDNGDAWYLDETRARAGGRWYITETYRRAATADTPARPGVLRAHYDDTYVSTATGWRFANRILVTHYTGPSDLSATFFNTAANMTGAFDA